MNGISSIKYNHLNMTPYVENIEVLDPGPAGTGEWVAITAPKWDLNWVSCFFLQNPSAMENTSFKGRRSIMSGETINLTFI